MEKDKKTFGINVVFIVTFVTIFTMPVKCVSFRESFVARSLLAVFPPSDSPSESESPAPGPAVLTPTDSPANSPTDAENDYEEIPADSPAASPEASADSFSPANPPAESDVYSPAASPEAPAYSFSPADSPADEDIDYSADSNSPADSPAEEDVDSSTEEDVDSPATSPMAPADSISPAKPPESAYSTAASGPKLQSSPTSQPNQPSLSPEIKSICGKTDSPPLCESSISPLITPDLKPDVSSVLLLAIQASVNATKAAMATVAKVNAADCQELYDDAVANLEDAINAVKSSDMPTVNTNLSAAMTDYGTCNDGFEESGEPNPLGDVGDKLTKMVSNCLAISTLIK